MKDYLTNVRENVAQRKFVSEEYFRSKLLLNEKKNKRLLMDKSSWDLDPRVAESSKINMEDAYVDVDVARRFMFRDVRLLGNIENKSVR